RSDGVGTSWRTPAASEGADKNVDFSEVNAYKSNQFEARQETLFVEIGRGAAQSQKLPLALRKPLKTPKTAMGAACQKLAWIRGWRRFRLAWAPRRRCDPGSTR